MPIGSLQRGSCDGRCSDVQVPQIDYPWIVGAVVCGSFFVKGAQMERRSGLVWGGASVLTWLAATWLLGGGLLVGVLGQMLLFAGLTIHAMRREAARD